MKVVSAFFALFLLFLVSSYAKPVALIDSLYSELSIAKADTQRVNILNDLTKAMRFTQPDSALKYGEEALALGEKLHFKQGIATAYNNLGVTNGVKGNLLASMTYFEKSLNVWEELGNKSRVGSCLNNLGVIAKEQKNYEQALDYYERSLAARKEINDTKNLAGLYANLGYLKLLQGDMEEANEYIQKARTLYLAQNDLNGLASFHFLMGEIYLQKDNYSEARGHFKESQKMFEEVGYVEGSISSAANLGKVYRLTGNYAKASSLLESVKIKAEEKGLIRQIVLIYRELINVNQKKGNYKKANVYFEHYAAMKDSLLSLETTNQLNALYSEIQQEEKENEILVLENDKAQQKLISLNKDAQISKQKRVRNAFLAGLVMLLVVALIFFRTNRLLTSQKEEIESKNLKLADANFEIRKQNDEIVAKSESLQQLMIEKNRIIGIIGHDLRTPINSLQGLSSLINHYITTGQFNELRMLVREMDSSLENINYLLENLLNWALSQQVSALNAPGNLQLKQVVSQAISVYDEVSKSKDVRIETSVDDKLGVYADQRAMGAVFRNLISNAIKFSHRGGLISVTSEDINEKVHISIKDNGVGMPPKNLKELFHLDKKKVNQGTEGERGVGLGLVLCQAFVNRYDGEIFVESKENQGTRITVSLPKILV